jgi:hypothetical protein
VIGGVTRIARASGLCSGFELPNVPRPGDAVQTHAERLPLQAAGLQALI